MARAAGEFVIRLAVLGVDEAVDAREAQRWCQIDAQFRLQALHPCTGDIGIGESGVVEPDQVLAVAAEQRERGVEIRSAHAVFDPEIGTGGLLGLQAEIPVGGIELIQGRGLKSFADARAEPPAAADPVADIAAEAGGAAEAVVIVQACAQMRGQSAEHPARLHIGAGDRGILARIAVGLVLAPFAIAAEGQRQPADQPVFAAQRQVLRIAVAGEQRIATHRGIEIVARGVGQRIGGAQGEVLPIIGQPQRARELLRLLRFGGVAQRVTGRGEAIDVDVAVGVTRVGEQFELVGQIDEDRPAQRELLRSVRFGSRCGGREAVGAEIGRGEPGKIGVFGEPAGGTGEQRVARAVFDAARQSAAPAGRDVEHARDRVRTPDRAVGAAQQVDLAHRAGGQRAEVEPARGRGRIGHPYAVDQHQQLLGLAPAHAHAGEGAGRSVAAEGDARSASEHAGDVGALHRLDLVAADHGDSLAGVLDAREQPGGGDGDRLDFPGRVGVIGVVGVVGEDRLLDLVEGLHGLGGSRSGNRSRNRGDGQQKRKFTHGILLS